MFNRLKTIFKGKDSAASTPAPSKFAPAAPVKVDEKGKPEKDKGKASAAVASPGKATGKAVSAQKKPPTPEELCGITPKMGKEEVRTKLALLYKRYNRATSSLDPKMRAESEEMLDAIVSVREKVFGAI